MRFTVTALFLATLAAGCLYVARLATVADDTISKYSWAWKEGPDAKASAVEKEAYYERRQRLEWRTYDICNSLWWAAALGGPLLAIEAMWLAAVWRGWPSLHPAARAAVKGSMRGAFCLLVAVNATMAIVLGWTAYAGGWAIGNDKIPVFVIGSAGVGAAAGAAVGGLWGWLRGRRSQPLQMTE
jgi:hypothetical protein